MYKSLLPLPLALLLGACATTPQPIAGEFTAVTPAQSVASGRTGERVRWGGVIIRVEPRAVQAFEMPGDGLAEGQQPVVRGVVGPAQLQCLDAPGGDDPRRGEVRLADAQRDHALRGLHQVEEAADAGRRQFLDQPRDPAARPVLVPGHGATAKRVSSPEAIRSWPSSLYLRSTKLVAVLSTPFIGASFSATNRATSR